MNGSAYAQENPPPYAEYAHEVDYLATQQVPVNDSGYWENTRNDALRYLGDQGGQCVILRPLIFFNDVLIVE